MMRTSTRKERIKQAIRVLGSLTKANRRIDMNSWKRCEMVACAAGWMAQDPWFRERGLRLATFDKDSVDNQPTYKGAYGYTALADFFGMTSDQSRHLFSPRSYDIGDRYSSRAVAKQLKSFLKENFK